MSLVAVQIVLSSEWTTNSCHTVSTIPCSGLLRSVSVDANTLLPISSYPVESINSSTDFQEMPASFTFNSRSDEKKEMRSVYSHRSGPLITVQGKQVQLRGSHPFTFSVEQAPISVCMDGEYGYAVSKDNYIRKFNVGSGETIHKWPVPNNSPYHHQMTVIDGKIYYCNVNTNEIIIFPTSNESTLEESRMSLEILEKPCYIADNTKHHEETVIVSGASGVGKFPIAHGFSHPEWFTRVEHAKGICVDDGGLIYVAKCQPTMICMLSQQTGKCKIIISIENWY